MSSLNEVLSAIGDFRAQMFTEQSSAQSALTASAASIGLRGMVGQLVSPLANIHATGIGVRIRKGKLLPREFVLKVYVFTKKEGIESQLPPILARPFQGVEIDVEEMPVQQIRAGRATTKNERRRRNQLGKRPPPKPQRPCNIKAEDAQLLEGLRSRHIVPHLLAHSVGL